MEEEIVIIDVKVGLKAVVVGVAAAVVLIVVNGLNYLVQDVLFSVVNVGWSTSSAIASLSAIVMYPIGVIVGLAAGILAVWLCREGIKSMKSIVVIPAVAGVTIGALTFVARIGYELALRPIISGYSVSPVNALTEIISACSDSVMIAGLAIAGGAICAAFLLNAELKK